MSFPPSQGRRGLAPSALVGLIALAIVIAATSYFYVVSRCAAELQAAEQATLGAIASARAAEAASLTGGEEARRLSELYLSDPRISDLLGGCSQEHYYDRDTSDMIPVLVEKLVSGYTEPLQRSKEELARLGPEAIEGVRRLADKWYTDSTGSSYLQNALDVAVMSDEPLAREIVLRFLDHPRDSLRRMAMRGMSKRHAIPADFDRLWVQLESDTVNNQELVIPGMYKADPERAEELFLDWLENDSHSHLWNFFAAFIAASERPETIARSSQLQAQTAASVRPFIAASAAKSGDAAARAALAAVLADGAELERERATFACAQAHLDELLLSALVKDEVATVRIAAATGLASLEPTPEIDARLAESLGDSDETVRKIALEALVRRGDAAGSSQALALLEGNGDSRNEALSVLRERMKVDQDLASRARSRLILIDQTRKQLPTRGALRNSQITGLDPRRGDRAVLARGRTCTSRRALESAYAPNAHRACIQFG